MLEIAEKAPRTLVLALADLVREDPAAYERVRRGIHSSAAWPESDLDLAHELA